MHNQETTKKLEAKIKEKEEKLKHCTSLVDELELLVEFDDLYTELKGDTFLQKE